MTDPKPPNKRDEQQEQEEWYERTRYLILLFAGGIALFGLVLGLILDWYIDPQTSTQKKDLVQALGLITAGVAGAGGIVFTWRGQRQAREAQEENQQSTQAQLSLAREGQITERFTRAIDQLGQDHVEFRLGGIYALARIARESEEDHWPIMEVLTTYVRQHAPLKLEKESTKESSDEAVRTPGPDIQAIMTVLRRRTRYYGYGEPELIDLHETNLQGSNLYKANLYGADLHGAHLEGANLRATQSLLSDELEEAVTDERTALLNHLRTDAAPASGSSYHVEQGDTLWRIADKKYKDRHEWPRIHQANDWILDPDRIQAGWWIWIPTQVGLVWWGTTLLRPIIRAVFGGFRHRRMRLIEGTYENSVPASFRERHFLGTWVNNYLPEPCRKDSSQIHRRLQI